MSVLRRRRRAQQGPTLQLTPELVSPAEVLFAKRVFGPRTTMLGDIIVAVQNRFVRQVSVHGKVRRAVHPSHCKERISDIGRTHRVLKGLIHHGRHFQY